MEEIHSYWVHHHRAYPYTTSTKEWQLISKSAYDKNFGAGRTPPVSGVGTR